MIGFDLVKKNGLKDVIAISENEEFKDLSQELVSTEEEQIKFITKDSFDGLDIIRHSAAHLMAAAIKKLYPQTLFTVGPSVENAFYYDIDLDKTISTEDFAKIEAEMNSIVKEDIRFIRKEVSKQEALELFKDNKYKQEIINELPPNSNITIYSLGDYVDLCRGPHVPSTRYLKYFKLTKVAGAYWRADANNKQLQRIYGTAWDSKEKLDNWFKFLEEAERRDHKKICKAMDLAHWESEYAPGAAFWHPKGWFIWLTFVDFLRKMKYKAGYVECHTPRVMNRVLWEISGHWANYGEHNYGGKTQDEMQFAVKPMNCPGGIMVYNSSPKSYRDLPVRMAEFGEVNRFEASGSLNGLLRCREFTQDDAHVWCTEDQMDKEINDMIALFYKIYNTLGFKGESVEIALSLRPEKRIGSEEIWDSAEKLLSDGLTKAGLKFKLQPGDGAFYGPKIEFGFKDAIGRSWQIGTIQLDMNLPARFNMTYVGKDGIKHTPIMLHAACFGAIDRFMGMYIENIEGKFPLWINPIQACILNINEKVSGYCEDLLKALREQDIRVELDLDNKTLQQKIAIHSLEKIPYLLIIGDKEKEANTVSIRMFGSNNNITMPVEEFITKVNNKVKNKDLDWNL